MDDPDRATGSASPNTCHPASGLHCSSTGQEQSLTADILTPASARATSNQKAQAPGQAPNDLAKAPDLDGLVSCRRFPIPSQPHASYHRVSNSPHTPPPPRSRHETESAASGRLAKLQCAGRPVILIQHLHNTAATKIGFFSTGCINCISHAGGSELTKRFVCVPASNVSILESVGSSSLVCLSINDGIPPPPPHNATQRHGINPM